MVGPIISFLIAFSVVTVGYSTYKAYTYQGINIISKRTMSRILKEYGLSRKFDEGNIFCPITKKVITYKNVGIIRKPQSFSEPIFITNDISVMRQASEYSDQLLFRLSHS